MENCVFRNSILSTISRATANEPNLCADLCYSILGMNLFGCRFCKKDSTGKTNCDRKNFDSLLWACITVFQVYSRGRCGRPRSDQSTYFWKLRDSPSTPTREIPTKLFFRQNGRLHFAWQGRSCSPAANGVRIDCSVGGASVTCH